VADPSTPAKQSPLNFRVASEERSFAALKMTTKDEGNGDVNGAQLKSLCGNSEVFVGRGFSHDVNIARSARLHSLRKNARDLVLRG